MRSALHLTLLWLTACSTDDILVASLPSAPPDAHVDASSAGQPADAGQRICMGAMDCGVDEYCERATCRAPAGVCQRRPSLCGREQAPVCGCDGISYYNDCVRRSMGVNALRSGECLWEAYPCGRNADCPAGASCAALLSLGEDCMHSGPPDSKCWVVPECNQQPQDGDSLISCADLNAPCVDACSAIAAGGLYMHADLGCRR